MENIFVKNNIESVKDLLKNINADSIEAYAISNAHLNSILKKSCFSFGLISLLITVLVPLISQKTINWETYLVQIFAMTILGAGFGILGGILIQAISLPFIKKLKFLKKKQGDNDKLLVKLLSTEDFQKNFIVHLNKLENSCYTSPENKFFLLKFKMDIISLFYSGNISEACVKINTNAKLLDNIYNNIIDYESKELFVETYMIDKKLLEEKKKHVLEKSGLHLNYDYRTQV